MRCTFIEYCFGFALYHMPLAGGPLSVNDSPIRLPHSSLFDLPMELYSGICYLNRSFYYITHFAILGLG